MPIMSSCFFGMPHPCSKCTIIDKPNQTIKSKTLPSLQKINTQLNNILICICYKYLTSVFDRRYSLLAFILSANGKYI